MLRLFPSHTFHDAAQSPGLDTISLKSFLTRHESGIWALVAPTEPTAADGIDPAAVAAILRLLRDAFAYVVIDTPAAFSEPVLAAFDESDWVVMLATLDVPSIKNLRGCLKSWSWPCRRWHRGWWWDMLAACPGPPHRSG